MDEVGIKVAAWDISEKYETSLLINCLLGGGELFMDLYGHPRIFYRRGQYFSYGRSYTIGELMRAYDAALKYELDDVAKKIMSYLLSAK